MIINNSTCSKYRMLQVLLNFIKKYNKDNVIFQEFKICHVVVMKVELSTQHALSRNFHFWSRVSSLISHLLQSRFVRPKLQAYAIVGKDQSADEHLCIKTAGCEASAEDISYPAASYATRAISLFRPNPSYFSPPGCLPPISLPPPYTELPSRRSATVSVHPSFPVSSPLSRPTTTGALLSSLGQRDFIKLLLRAHRRHFASLTSPLHFCRPFASYYMQSEKVAYRADHYSVALLAGKA